MNVKIPYALLLLILVSQISFATTKIITNHFELFNPDSVTIYLGDTIDFQIDSFHNAIQVNESAWDSGWADSNGGFNVPFGGGIWVPTSGGVFYFVCELHAHDGMAGRIFVIDPNGIEKQNRVSTMDVTVTPNPFFNYCQAKYFLPQSGKVSVVLINQMGERIKVLQFGFQIQGNYNLTLHATDFPSSGIYFLQIESDENKFLKTISIFKQ